MKTKKIIITVIAAIVCLSSLSLGLHITASEPTATQTPSEMYSPSLIYQAFESEVIAETSLEAEDWKSLPSYSNRWNNWVDWENTDEFNLPCDITTYYRNTDADEPTGAVLYVIGHSAPRVGTESDVSIIEDLLEDGYIVVLVDFLDNEKAVTPYLDCATYILSWDVSKNQSFVGDYYSSKLSGHTVVLPAGYRMVKDVEFFDVPTQAAAGTLDYVVSCYNKDATKNTIDASGTGVTWAEAKTIDDVIMPNGKPITDVESGNRDKFLKYHLDIYYPSMPVEGVEVPMMTLASSGTTRSFIGQINRIQPTGALFGGYAFSVYDHEYTCFMLGEDSWGHIDGAGFTLQSANGVKMHTAAIRCLKYYAEDYGYSNEKIGVMGHSKSSYVVTLSGINPDKFYESGVYSGQKRDDNYGDQPFLTYKDGTPISSDVTCVYHSMGAGSINRQHFLAPANVPTFIACGVLDNANPAPRDYWEQEFKDYNEIGIHFAGVYMPEIGHTYPPYFTDPIFGYNYYMAFRAFFDYYLKGEAPEVMYTGIKADGTIDVDDKGLFIYFSAPITEWSLLKSVKVTSSTGAEIEGTWVADCGGSRWTFKTDAFIAGQTYTLTLADSAADINGTAIAEGFTKTFTVN